MHTEINLSTYLSITSVTFRYGQTPSDTRFAFSLHNCTLTKTITERNNTYETVSIRNKCIRKNTFSNGIDTALIPIEYGQIRILLPSMADCLSVLVLTAADRPGPVNNTRTGTDITDEIRIVTDRTDKNGSPIRSVCDLCIALGFSGGLLTVLANNTFCVILLYPYIEGSAIFYFILVLIPNDPSNVIDHITTMVQFSYTSRHVSK